MSVAELFAMGFPDPDLGLLEAAESSEEDSHVRPMLDLLRSRGFDEAEALREAAEVLREVSSNPGRLPMVARRRILQRRPHPELTMDDVLQRGGKKRARWSDPTPSDMESLPPTTTSHIAAEVTFLPETMRTIVFFLDPQAATIAGVACQAWLHDVTCHPATFRKPFELWWQNTCMLLDSVLDLPVEAAERIEGAETAANSAPATSSRIEELRRSANTLLTILAPIFPTLASRVGQLEGLHARLARRRLGESRVGEGNVTESVLACREREEGRLRAELLSRAAQQLRTRMVLGAGDEDSPPLARRRRLDAALLQGLAEAPDRGLLRVVAEFKWHAELVESLMGCYRKASACLSDRAFAFRTAFETTCLMPSPHVCSGAEGAAVP